MFLTQDGGFLNPITKLFGLLMNLIYDGISVIGLGNIGVAIIIFTIITRLILHPMTVKQQKSSKIMQFIQPEIKAIQKKYEGKEDQMSMLQQQQEMKEVYEKYGTSMTGGCVQLLIQLPIILALYRVIMNIPAYVNVIKQYYINIVEAIGGVESISKLQEFAKDNNLQNLVNQLQNFGVDKNLAIGDQENLIIDFLYKLNPTQWQGLLNSLSENVNVITENLDIINHANTFLGLNLATAPSMYGLTLNPYLLIPVLAFLSQYIATKFMQASTTPIASDDESSNQMNQTMKTMNLMMPLMSAYFCYTFATGIGLYWIVSAVLMTIQQVLIQKQLNKLDMDSLIAQNIEKANKKREKKGLKPIDIEKTISRVKKMDEIVEKKEEEKSKRIEGKEEKEQAADKYYFENENRDSLFSKANMVAKYNEKQNK